MSGPKVVNIEAVRRQQRRECNELLRQLSQAVEDCLRFQKPEDQTRGGFESGAIALLDRLRAMGETEQWGNLRAEAAAQRDFYGAEAERLYQRAADERSTALRSEQNLRIAAEQALKGLRTLTPSAERDAAIQSLSIASDKAAVQAAVIQATDLLAIHRREREQADDSAHLRELATAYATPEDAGAPAHVIPAAGRDPEAVRLDNLCALVGKLETFEPTASTGLWRRKLHEVAAADSDNRSRLLDSLGLELTTELRQCRVRRDAIRAAEALRSDLAPHHSAEASAWHERVSTALSSQAPPEQLMETVTTARRWLDEENAREDAREQREAVLKALGALGYEVREGMAAAWTEEGRVVVHKPSDAVYGVELSAPASGPAFQVRVVAAESQSRTKQRDLEVEQTWCGEFARLQTMLSDNGFRTTLAHAQVPGAVPVKTVQSSGSAKERPNAERPTHRRGQSN